MYYLVMCWSSDCVVETFRTWCWWTEPVMKRHWVSKWHSQQKEWLPCPWWQEDLDVDVVQVECRQDSRHLLQHSLGLSRRWVKEAKSVWKRASRKASVVWWWWWGDWLKRSWVFLCLFSFLEMYLESWQCWEEKHRSKSCFWFPYECYRKEKTMESKDKDYGLCRERSLDSPDQELCVHCAWYGIDSQ